MNKEAQGNFNGLPPSRWTVPVNRDPILIRTRIRNTAYIAPVWILKAILLTLGIVYSTMVNLNHQLFLDGRYGTDVKLTGLYPWDYIYERGLRFLY
jgi:hypothetical protein